MSHSIFGWTTRVDNYRNCEFHFRKKTHGKGLGHMFQKQFNQLLSNSLFLHHHKPKMIFGQTTRVDSDRKCEFHRFCPARTHCNNSSRNSIMLKVIRFIIVQFIDKIQKLNLKYFHTSVIRGDPFLRPSFAYHTPLIVR